MTSCIFNYGSMSFFFMIFSCTAVVGKSTFGIFKQSLHTLQTNSFLANRKKCNFGQRQMEYLGHIILTARVTMDPAKIEDVIKWLILSNVWAVKGFLGLIGYYRKFILSYGMIARPLTNLLKKNAFEWTIEAQVAFEELKRAITIGPVLALLDFSLPFVIECDATGTRVGAILMQQDKPIAYFSKALADRTLSQRMKKNCWH